MYIKHSFLDNYISLESLNEKTSNTDLINLNVKIYPYESNH